MLWKIKDKLIQLVYTGRLPIHNYLHTDYLFIPNLSHSISKKIGPLHTQEQLQSVNKYLKAMNKQ